MGCLFFLDCGCIFLETTFHLENAKVFTRVSERRSQVWSAERTLVAFCSATACLQWLFKTTIPNHGEPIGWPVITGLVFDECVNINKLDAPSVV